jgi:hypothetical protein
MGFVKPSWVEVYGSEKADLRQRPRAALPEGHGAKKEDQTSQHAPEQQGSEDPARSKLRAALRAH